MSEHRCKACKWWVKTGPLHGQTQTKFWGVCCRHAPRPMIDLYNSDYPTDEMAIWPKTREENFCGEFQAKEKI